MGVVITNDRNDERGCVRPPVGKRGDSHWNCGDKHRDDQACQDESWYVQPVFSEELSHVVGNLQVGDEDKRLAEQSDQQRNSEEGRPAGGHIVEGG